jgi:hypothetical protein
LKIEQRGLHSYRCLLRSGSLLGHNVIPGRSGHLFNFQNTG